MKKLASIAIALLILSIPLNSQGSEFLNTIMHLNFGFSFGFPYGEIINTEHNAFVIPERYKGKTENQRPEHYETAFGASIDLTPFKPIILGNEAHALKFGLRGGYRAHFLQQNLTIREGATYTLGGVTQPNSKGKDLDFGGPLLTFQSWMVGPVIHYAPFIDSANYQGSYTAMGGFTFYALFGQVFGGELTAYPARRDSKETITPYKSKVEGYKIDVGIGGEIAVCSINLGLNVYYSYIHLTTETRIYPTVGRESDLHEVNLEVYIGIPIIWSKFPKVI